MAVCTSLGDEPMFLFFFFFIVLLLFSSLLVNDRQTVTNNTPKALTGRSRCPINNRAREEDSPPGLQVAICKYDAEMSFLKRYLSR